MRNDYTTQLLIFMCPPDHLTARPEVHANKKEAEHYQGILAGLGAFRSEAHRLWEVLKKGYENEDAFVSVIPPLPSASDQTYTADPAFTLVNDDLETVYVMASKFSNEHRSIEVDAFVNHLRKTFEAHSTYKNYKILIHQMTTPFEGTGDNIYDPNRDLIFSGYTTHLNENDPSQGRSSLESHQTLSDATGVEVVSLEVQYPCFHIDTCLGFLPGGHGLVYRAGMTDEAFTKLQQKAFEDFGLEPQEHLIDVTQNEAENHLVTNFVSIGNKVFMPHFGEGEYEPVRPELKAQLDALGYDVIWVDVSAFIKVGGAAHCISHLLHHRVSGGLLRRNNV